MEEEDCEEDRLSFVGEVKEERQTMTMTVTVTVTNTQRCVVFVLPLSLHCLDPRREESKEERKKVEGGPRRPIQYEKNMVGDGR